MEFVRMGAERVVGVDISQKMLEIACQENAHERISYLNMAMEDISAIDGKFDIADVVLLQKWLLAVPDSKLADWKAADLYDDNRLDVFDLCMMKRKLISG